MFSTKANRKLARYLSKCLETHTITLEQWAVLSRLSEELPSNQKVLAEKADKDQATLGRILDILERKELTKRQVDTQDRRSFTILITDKGKQLKQQIAPVIEDAFKRILNDISEEKLNTFRDVLTKMNENIDREYSRLSEKNH